MIDTLAQSPKHSGKVSLLTFREATTAKNPLSSCEKRFDVVEEGSYAEEGRLLCSVEKGIQTPPERVPVNSRSQGA